MTIRQFDNNNQLIATIIKFRFSSLDTDAIIATYQTDIRNPETQEITGQRYYVSIDSMLTDQQIENILSTAATQGELDDVQKEKQSKLNAQNIPNWATYTEAEALAWMQTNIGTPLATVIPPNPMTVQQIRAVLVVLQNTMNSQYQAEQSMARMIIALRDKTWPNL